jgi:hypothetical protein
MYLISFRVPKSIVENFLEKVSKYLCAKSKQPSPNTLPIMYYIYLFEIVKSVFVSEVFNYSPKVRDYIAPAINLGELPII